MLDIRIIREDPERVKAALRDLNDAESIPLIDRVLVLDERRRSLLQEVEAMRREKNTASKQISQTGDQRLREEQIKQMRELNTRLISKEFELREVEDDFDEEMMWLPNLPAEGVPVGADESENVVIRTEGELPEFGFEPLPHWDLGPILDVIDFERGVKLAGSRFYVLKGLGARLQRALITWMIDVHVNEHGYTEVYPPFMVRRETLVGTGNLPKFADNLYRDHEEDFWLIPTAEVPVTNLHRDEILREEDLPLYYVAYSPCFRREKMSAGRDVRGMKRGHQFDKVELVKIVEGNEEISEAELQSLIEDAVEITRRLGLPHRLVQMCTGDLSFVAARKYDIEVWAAGSQEWLEVSSCSNFFDFQARRMGLRYRPERGPGTRFAHTLNGSGLALPRLMIAILENYQQKDGSVVIPEVLRPYMGGMKRITVPVG